LVAAVVVVAMLVAAVVVAGMQETHSPLRGLGIPQA
jgi:hypothetical protein